ncbi:siderophore-interacting protein [Plantactinospora soyae]|uniref:NADPH-dependent ferric siderophore reductase n=1 Tax=Plantactinospora soyae TaxID=1544732 RepID=A0A927RA67_9ACTN|nr:siderophore-interacting protein [Plantactinospora soyae]MBE1490471.1 NADPH-dependent ferric siderophore reductase [Plantactinospora soyae]
MTQLPIRHIRVADVQRITPHMARVSFTGDDLADLHLDGPDQQVKLYFPRPGQSRPRMPEPGPDLYRWYESFTAIPEPERPWTRSYTIRAHHPQGTLIDIDFALHHNAGPATRWALHATPGDTLAMFGPSPVFARPVPLTGTDWILLAADEAALPALGTIIEALPEGTRALAFVEVRDRSEEQRFDTRGEVTLRWLHRGDHPAGHGTLLTDAVRGADFPPGSVFAWLGAESGTVRALRRHLVGERRLPRRSVDFTGYWRLTLTQDDAPTEEDLVEARERLADASAAPGPN